MGSRAIAVVCRDEDVARDRFGIEGQGAGVFYTRTGRAFFGPGDDASFEGELLARLRAAADRCELWDRLATDWFCLDAELMPWSAKAGELLDEHYRPVAEAARLGIAQATAALDAASARGLDCGDLAAEFRARSAMADDYAAVLQRAIRRARAAAARARVRVRGARDGVRAGGPAPVARCDSSFQVPRVAGTLSCRIRMASVGGGPEGLRSATPCVGTPAQHPAIPRAA